MTTLWQLDAACAQEPRLPWISEALPSAEDRAQMGAICAACPVQGPCAEWIVDRVSQSRIAGGFYAGTWLPWPPSATPAATGNGRRRALDTLRQKALDSRYERVLSDEERYVRGRH